MAQTPNLASTTEQVVAHRLVTQGRLVGLRLAEGELVSHRDIAYVGDQFPALDDLSRPLRTSNSLGGEARPANERTGP